MTQLKIPHRFPKTTNVAEFDKVSMFATQTTENMKNFILDQMILICANNDGKIDFESRNFKDLQASLFNADPNAPENKGRAVISVNKVIADIVERSQKSKLSKKNTEKLLTEIKTNINNFKNTLVSNKAAVELLITKRKVTTLINKDIVHRDSTGIKLIGVEKDLGDKIAKNINLSSAQLIIKSNESKLRPAINRHLASLIPESDIKTGKTQFTKENIRDTAGFISNFCEVFNKRDDIAITFYKSVKNGVNKVKELCKDEKHLPEILANLFFSKPGQDDRFDLEHVGLYLSDVGDINKKTLEHFVALHDFHNKDFLDSLRAFLQSFKLPGEAQKIDRLMEAFSSEYIKQNPSSEIGSSDNAYVLSFAAIMLSTDLHNPKNTEKMTFEKFKKNLRGCNNGQDFDGALLEKLYKSIKDNALGYVTNEPPGYEIRTSELVKDNTYNKLSDYLHNYNFTAKDIFPNLQDADKWNITHQGPKPWLSKFMGYQGNIVLSNKDNENVIIQIYEPSILSRWFLSEQHKVIIQPTRGAINAAAMIAASIKPEVTSTKSTYDYAMKDLKKEYTKARSTPTPTHSVPRHIQDIIMNNEDITKPLYKAHIIQDSMDHEIHKSNIRKYDVKRNSERSL